VFLRSARLVEERDRGVPFFAFLFAYALSVELSALSAGERLVGDCLPSG
jgi:hypothetical protein